MQAWRRVVVVVARQGQAQALLPRDPPCARHLSTALTFLAKKKNSKARGKTQPQSSHLQQLVLADTHYLEKQKHDILQIFPNVKSTIKNVFHSLSTNLNSEYSCEEKTTATGRINNQLVFQSTLTLTWPRHLTFTGYGFTKKNAENSATTKAAEMLYKENYLTASGYPVTASSEERQQLLRDWNLPPSITLPAATLQEGQALLQHYEEEVQPLMDQVRAEVCPPAGVGLEAGDEEGPMGMLEEEGLPQMHPGVEEEQQLQEFPLNLLTGQRLSPHEQQNDKKYRNDYLHHLRAKRRHRQAGQEKDEGNPPLPMLHYRDEVLTTLQNKRVLVVSGDTGCGKSTQVPQMILDQWVVEDRGAECNILVTQPRRISAISLAKRVARERGEKLGESIGYHVRLEHQPVRGSGGVMFCTAGMLLQSLHLNPELAGVSHVIVDEVHERSVQIDILLILLRRLLRQHPSLRLVLMSASLSTEELLHYFEEEEAALIEVPGTLYPITRHYLPASLQVLGINPQHHNLYDLMKPDSLPVVNVNLVVDVILSIDDSRPPGAILCFLPGWQDISLVQSKLQEAVELGRRLCILPMHSRLPTGEQEQIFEPPPPGKRKVVLATNLAETSLTVTDVVYVVDTGFHKEQRYNNKRHITVLGNHWISRANSQQRAGRAGRVQPGEVFHLYSSEVHQDMPQFPIPEIMRIQLEHIILQCKAHCGNEGVRTFLAEGMNVPSHRSISTALATLEKLGMLTPDPQQGTEHLTSLGKRVTHFSTPPHLSKAMVWGSLFRCVDPVLSISATLTGGRGIFYNNIDLRAKTREVKAAAHATSDLLALYNLQQAWRQCGRYEKQLYFCNERNLSHRYLRFNEGIKELYAGHLYDARLLDQEDVQSQFSHWNTNRRNNQLVLGMLLAGAGRILHYQRGSYQKGILNAKSLSIRTEKGELVGTGSDCVLHKLPKDTTGLLPHLLCLDLSRDEVSRRMVARDLSMLQPLTVALFAGDSLEPMESHDGVLLVSVDGKEKCSFQVDQSTGQFLLQLRDALDQAVDYLVDTRGLHTTSPEAEYYCENLLSYVSNLLMTQGEKSPARVGEYDDNDESPARVCEDDDSEKEDEQPAYRKRKAALPTTFFYGDKSRK